MNFGTVELIPVVRILSYSITKAFCIVTCDFNLLLSVEQFGFLNRSFRLLRQGVRECLVCIVSDHFSTLYGTLFKILAIVVLLSSSIWILNWVPLSMALVQSC